METDLNLHTQIGVPCSGKTQCRQSVSLSVCRGL